MVLSGQKLRRNKKKTIRMQELSKFICENRNISQKSSLFCSDLLPPEKSNTKSQPGNLFYFRILGWEKGGRERRGRKKSDETVSLISGDSSVKEVAAKRKRREKEVSSAENETNRSFPKSRGKK